jgi:hypothetical protein
VGVAICIFALWLIAAALGPFSPARESWNNIVAGLIVACCGFLTSRHHPVPGIASGALGVWLVLAAFIPELLTGAALITNNTAVGLVLVLIGCDVLLHSEKSRLSTYLIRTGRLYR